MRYLYSYVEYKSRGFSGQPLFQSSLVNAYSRFPSGRREVRPRFLHVKSEISAKSRRFPAAQLLPQRPASQMFGRSCPQAFIFRNVVWGHHKMEYVIAATVSHARGWRAKLSSPPTHDLRLHFSHVPNIVSSQSTLLRTENIIRSHKMEEDI